MPTESSKETEANLRIMAQKQGLPGVVFTTGKAL